MHPALPVTATLTLHLSKIANDIFDRKPLLLTDLLLLSLHYDFYKEKNKNNNL